MIKKGKIYNFVIIFCFYFKILLFSTPFFLMMGWLKTIYRSTSFTACSLSQGLGCQFFPVDLLCVPAQTLRLVFAILSFQLLSVGHPAQPFFTSLWTILKSQTVRTSPETICQDSLELLFVVSKPKKLWIFEKMPKCKKISNQIKMFSIQPWWLRG